MKKLVLVVALSLGASGVFAASLPATPENIQKAENTPSAAKFFSPCPAFQPTGAEADKPGDTVSVNNFVVAGSSLTPAEAWKAYCVQGSGE